VKSYKRIAGYFHSSIFELAGEEIADIQHVQIVCNSEFDAADVVVSQHVRETALKERWNEAPAEVLGSLNSKLSCTRWNQAITGKTTLSSAILSYAAGRTKTPDLSAH
jgi:hypothetical protein